MKTKLLYLDDSYLKEVDATIVDVQPDNNGMYKLILDQTIFYPMGGGQPTDQGKLSSDSWQGNVNEVLLKEGEVWHYVKTQTASTVGMKVHGVLDWDRRYKNMRYHSAGHIIDYAIYLLGYSPKTLSPQKADHGKHPYIEYMGTVNEDIKEKLQEKVNELIAKDLTISWEFQPYEALQKEAIYLQPNLPTNKPLRTLRLEGVGAVADGGTQIRKTSEAGKVSVDFIESIADITRIHYSLPA